MVIGRLLSDAACLFTAGERAREREGWRRGRRGKDRGGEEERGGGGDGGVESFLALLGCVPINNRFAVSSVV